MIALDAMGGDRAPYSTVGGAIRAAEKGIPVTLFGQKNRLLPILHEYSNWQALPLSIAEGIVPVTTRTLVPRSLLREDETSLVSALRAVAAGQASAVVAAGNSGAALIGGVVILGKVEGIARPAIGDFLPTQQGEIFCLDLGANTDCKPEYLEQFALMGRVYVQIKKQIEEPLVGLLSNGVEPYKGTAAGRKVYEILARSGMPFLGNVESRDLFDTSADILVCDGFAGNVLLKAIQGTISAVTSLVKKEATSSWFNRLIFALGAQKIFAKISNRSDYGKKGGALLLGLKKPLVVAHGCSDARAIENAILFAHATVKDRFLHVFNERLTCALQRYKAHISHSSLSSIGVPPSARIYM